MRPGALVAVVALDRPVLDVAGDLSRLGDQCPGVELRVASTPAAFEVRAAGEPCNCHRCAAEDAQVRADSGLYSWWSGLNSHGMILCPVCGNKRCPKASDHTLECGDSNDTGQVGSVYA